MSDSKYSVSISILARKDNGKAGVTEYVTREFKIQDDYTNDELEELITNITPAYRPDNSVS